MDLIWLIPLLPGLGAAVNGIFGIRWFSKRTAGVVACTTMAAAFGLSVLAFVQLLGLEAEARVHDVVLFDWIPATALAMNGQRDRRAAHPVGVPPRPAVGDDDPRRHGDRLPDPRLLDRLHARRAARRRGALLRLPEPVLLLHAHAGAGRQLPGHVRRLGGRRPLLVPAHRLLVREEERLGCGQEGVHHQPRRRLGIPARRLPDLLHVRLVRFPRGGERRVRAPDRDGPVRHAVAHHAAAVRRRAAARARRSRSTSGCRTRWKARRPSPR